MRLTKQDFSPEAFALDEEAGDFPSAFPLSYKQLAYAQGKDKKLQDSLKTKAGKAKYVMKTYNIRDGHSSEAPKKYFRHGPTISDWHD
jgi:hypothetical protein